MDRPAQVGQDAGERIRSPWQTIRAGNIWRGQFINQKKSGEEFWESVSIAPIFDKKHAITHVVAVKLDITDRMRMEEAIRESEVKYRELVEKANASTRRSSLTRGRSCGAMMSRSWGWNSNGEPSYCSRAVLNGISGSVPDIV